MLEKAAYMSRFCAAELRDKGIELGKENVQYVRDQARNGNRMATAFCQTVQKELLALSGTESGQELLKRIGVKEFDTVAEDRMRALLKWMGS